MSRFDALNDTWLAVIAEPDLSWSLTAHDGIWIQQQSVDGVQLIKLDLSGQVVQRYSSSEKELGVLHGITKGKAYFSGPMQHQSDVIRFTH